MITLFSAMIGQLRNSREHLFLSQTIDIIRRRICESRKVGLFAHAHGGVLLGWGTGHELARINEYPGWGRDERF
jgi:hypothetical protein